MPIDTPPWVERAVVYGVIPRNAGPQGLRSVTGRLDDLQALGIDALWLSPINASPPGDYGYAVTDYFDLNPRDGTKETFRELVRAAHARGIRVLMDFVPNHSSSQHPYFEDAQARGPVSPHYDWYDRDDSGAFTYYFNWENLPNLNFDNPRVRRWILDAFAYWVRSFDVDGFRVDVAWGIRQRRPDFWPDWRRELKAIKPDLLLLAEASARDSYYFTHGFDAAYDWTDELGHWAWERVFEESERLTERLHDALTNHGRGFHPDARIFRFLNNNDTGDRFITRYGPGMTRVATALLLTLPGIPCIYTGDEVGAAFHPYRDSGPISWEDHHDLRRYHQQLITLRKKWASLHSRSWLPVQLSGSRSLYGYLRFGKDGGDPVLVLLNFSGDAVDATATLPPEAEQLARLPRLVDNLSGEWLRTGVSLSVPMQPWSARILAGTDRPIS